MQNIQISQSKPKRSVQSLIDDSSIDNEPSVINFQILELKKAYNETYKSFHNKIQTLQSELDKYKQKCKKLQQANVSLAEKCYQMQKKKDQYNHMKICCEKMKRKVLYIQSKYQKLMENRSLVQQRYDDLTNPSEQKPGQDKWVTDNDFSYLNNQKVDKNEVYQQIADLISVKVKQFTKEVRVHSMSKQLELKIQTFLEELIYITPMSKQGFKGIKAKQAEKLATNGQENILLSDQKAWKELSRKIDPDGNERARTPTKRQNLFNQEQSKKANLRTRSPLAVNYNEDYLQDRQPGYRPSPKKTKIFSNY